MAANQDELGVKLRGKVEPMFQQYGLALDRFQVFHRDQPAGDEKPAEIRRSGLEVLASVRRAKPTLPVIVLTARGEIEDRVAGLDAGAVDYLVKPFSLAELVARVRAQLRVLADASASILRGADIEVNLLTRKVSRGGWTVALSTTEFELLVYLMRYCGQVLTREQILGSVWGYQHDPATNVVDVYIGYLRRKLGRPEDPAPIFTVRAVGYRLGTPS